MEAASVFVFNPLVEPKLFLTPRSLYLFGLLVDHMHRLSALMSTN